ncbi:MAG: hypothetical protein QOJ09_2483 [Actinomycetota bacterium]|nr:hypothetical protein [Actinomycetota bacterium]
MGVAARVAVGLVLLAAGAMKARDRAWPASAARFGLPRAVALGLPWLEVVVGALLVAQVGRRWTSAAALALLVAFTVAAARHVVRHDDVPCACFGSLSASPVSTRTIARNLVLVALAVLGTIVQ